MGNFQVDDEADEFVRSMLLTGKCISVWSIMKAGRAQGFSNEEIRAAKERNPRIEQRGTHQGGCWQMY